MKKITRREFAKTAAIAPIGLAAASSLLGQVGAASQSPGGATTSKESSES